MSLVLAILPLALLIAMMTSPGPGRWMPLPAHIALPIAAILAYALRLINPEGVPYLRIHAAALDGALSSLTPLTIIFGAIILFKSMQTSGAMDVLSARLRRVSPDPVAQLILVGWAFSFLVEGLSGFGTPAALAAPILAGLGFPVLRVAAMCLIMNSVPVSFGAVGMPTWFGLADVGLSPEELRDVGWRTALVHSAAAPFIVVLALLVVTTWSDIRRRLLFILLTVAGTIGPFLLASRFTVEFPSIVGGLCGLITSACLMNWRIGLPKSSDITASRRTDARKADSIAEPTEANHARSSATPTMSLGRAATPLAATVSLLAITRIDALGLKALLNAATPSISARVPALGEVWMSPSLVVGLRQILGTNTNWQMPLLYVPFILPFVLVALISIPLLRMSRAAALDAWSQTFRRLTRPAIALLGALILVKLMTAGDDTGQGAPVTVIGLAMADAAGSRWPYFAPLLGVLGSFFSGSNTVSNLTFAPIQAAIADTLRLDRTTILALQSAGGAMGNMVCIHNIVAVAAVLGLSERRDGTNESGGVASVLRLTILPLGVYILFAATMAGILTAAFG